MFGAEGPAAAAAGASATKDDTRSKAMARREKAMPCHFLVPTRRLREGENMPKAWVGDAAEPGRIRGRPEVFHAILWYPVVSLRDRSAPITLLYRPFVARHNPGDCPCPLLKL